MFNLIETRAFILEIQQKGKPAFAYVYFNFNWRKFQNVNMSLGQQFLPSGPGVSIGIAFVVCWQWVKCAWPAPPRKLSLACKSVSVFIFNTDGFNRTGSQQASCKPISVSTFKASNLPFMIIGYNTKGVVNWPSKSKRFLMSDLKK